MLRTFFKNPPDYRDVFILCIFTILITFQPFILYEEIMPWELSIYLPSIQAALNGLVPYRDFFYLRGPLEIYVPSLLMKLFSQSIPVLFYYFYAGTVASFLILIFLTRHLFKTRLIFYLFVFVVVARTFPYTYYFVWGGMRYALGLLSLFFLVLYFKNLNKDSKTWLIYLAAFSSSAAFLTATDVGLAAIVGTILGIVLAGLFKSISFKEFLHFLKHYLLGMMILFGFYGGYLIWTHSLNAYIENTFSVAMNITKVFDTPENNKYPASIMEWIWSMFPTAPHFKHMTPVYCYILFFGYIVHLYRRKQLTTFDSVYFCIAMYGLLLYVAAWRIIENAHFEMALMVEKILLFVLIERVCFILREHKTKVLSKLGSWQFQSKHLKQYLQVYGISALFLIIIFSSLGFAISRYSKRFDAFKVARNFLSGKELKLLEPNPGVVKKKLDMPRMKGIMMPQADAEEYEQLNSFIQERTRMNETVLFFPDYGMLNFIVDRPFLGRFANPKFAWFDNRWHQDFMQDLKEERPRLVVVQSPIPQYWKVTALSNKNNLDKFDEMLNYIGQHYSVIKKTKGFEIYQLN